MSTTPLKSVLLWNRRSTCRASEPLRQAVESERVSLLAPNRPLRHTENPRVAGSIPALATISKRLIFNVFRACPRTIGTRFGRKSGDSRTVGKWAVRGPGAAARPAIWELAYQTGFAVGPDIY